MHHSRFNTRKRFINDKEPQNAIPPKLPNKRTVFEDEDPPEEAAEESAERPANQQSAERPANQTSRGSFRLREIRRNPAYWRLLQVRGPVTISSYMLAEAAKNRALFFLMREIGDQLYHNFENYQKNELPVLIRNNEVMDVEQIMDCLKAMNEKTMKYEKNMLSVYFFTENVLHVIRSLLMGAPPPIRVFYDDFSALLEQLRSICSQRNISATESELVASRNGLARFLIHVQTDFATGFRTSNRPGLQCKDLVSNDVFKLASDYSTLIELSAFRKMSCRELCRSSKDASLWMLISCAARTHLLEFVFSYGLLEWLPWNVKEFLNGWMEKVQKRMRKRWANGDLQKVVEAVLDTDGEDVRPDSLAVREFLTKICDNVLNCNENFKVFDENLTSQAGTIMRAMTQASYFDCHKCDFGDFFGSPGFAHLASLFPRADTSHHLLRHVKAHLFHFFLKFCCHTTRFVFYIDSRNRICNYTGTVELEKVPDFKRIDEENAKFAKPSQKQQVVRPRKTLLPTPSPVLRQTNGFQNHHNHDAPLNTANHQPLEKIQFFPMPPSALYIPPTMYPPKNGSTDAILTPDVTEEELRSARALRPPSEGSTSIQKQEEEDEDVPKKWRDAYRLLLEWNQDLSQELKSVKERYRELC